MNTREKIHMLNLVKAWVLCVKSRKTWPSAIGYGSQVLMY